MKALSIEFKNFRNLNCKVELSDGVNLFVGNNGMGKTNIAEGIWLNSTSKSFRNATDKEMIKFGAEEAEMIFEFEGKNNIFGHIDTVFYPDKNRKITVNGIKLEKIGDILGGFRAVAFTPQTLSIIDDGPLERRRFLDIAISQLKPSYMHTLIYYNNALAARNLYLKKLRTGTDNYQLLAYECMMAPTGAKVMAERKMYVKRLSKLAGEEYQKITGGKEKLTLNYEASNGIFEDKMAIVCERIPTWSMGRIYGVPSTNEIFEVENAFLQKMHDTREKDIKDGCTGLGPHRDELEIFINGRHARDFASQGQKRSAVLAIKAAECRIIREETGEEPVVILDDVFSELDSERKKYILDGLSSGQTIITSCDTAYLGRAARGKVFVVKDGVATEKIRQENAK